MAIGLRRARGTDAETCARIMYEAFKDVADRHGFPPALPSIDVARRVAALFLGLPAIHGLLAIQGDEPVGVLFLDEGDPIRGVAIAAVDPTAQGRGIGRALMRAALERARGATGVRLVQEAFNTGSMGLYASLGFAVKEPLVRVSGRPRHAPMEGVEIRPSDGRRPRRVRAALPAGPRHHPRRRPARRGSPVPSLRCGTRRAHHRLHLRGARRDPRLGRGGDRGGHARAPARHRGRGPGSAIATPADTAGGILPMVPRAGLPDREAPDLEGHGRVSPAARLLLPVRHLLRRRAVTRGRSRSTA
jgi:ribosomal protein S18 acetylase RimI-like enzyme